MNQRALLIPLTVALIWGINVPVMKAALGELHPFLFNAARLTMSALALGVIWYFEKPSGPLPPLRWRTILWLGFLSSFFYQVLFLWGMDATSASHTALIIASGPLWTALLSALYRLEVITKGGALSLGTAFVGTLLVTASGPAAADPGAARAPLFGNLAILGSMITWAWATVLSRPVLETVSATRLAFFSVLVSLPGHWLLAFPHLGAEAPDRPGFVVAAILYSGVLSTGMAYALWNRSVVALGPARTATFSYLVPVVALTVAWLVLSETPSALQLIGGGLVIAGLLGRQVIRSARKSGSNGENRRRTSSNRNAP